MSEFSLLLIIALAFGAVFYIAYLIEHRAKSDVSLRRIALTLLGVAAVVAVILGAVYFSIWVLTHPTLGGSVLTVLIIGLVVLAPIFTLIGNMRKIAKWIKRFNKWTQR